VAHSLLLEVFTTEGIGTMVLPDGVPALMSDESLAGSSDGVSA